MKVSELVGKVVVRTQARTRTSPSYSFLNQGSTYLDTGYTTQPIEIVAVQDDVTYYRSEPEGKIQILGADYCDEHWAPVAEQFLDQLWKKRA